MDNHIPHIIYVVTVQSNGAGPTILEIRSIICESIKLRRRTFKHSIPMLSNRLT